MYHNTQVMLKHYRDIVWALECFPSEVAQELDQPLKDLDALLSVVDTQVALGNAKLEHRLLSIRKSRLLLDRINEALTVLRHKPGNGELMYNIIFQTFITPDKPREITAQLIIEVVSEHFHISVDQMISKTRSSEIARPRQIAMYLCKTMTSDSLDVIGQLLGGRDHSTIIHGIKKVTKDYEENDSTRTLIETIKKKINPN